METAFLLALLVAAVALFATEKISVDIITLLLLAALTVTGILTPKEAFAGFSNDITTARSRAASWTPWTTSC